jgi:UV DNA damage repair endonuclease
MNSIGIPEITYLGFPLSFNNPKYYISSKKDFLNLIYRSILENTKKGIKNLCVDSSEMEFSSDFFSDLIDEENQEIDQLIQNINKIIILNSSKIFFYCSKEYFLASQIEEVKNNTILLLNSISSIFDSIGINYPSIIIRVGSAYGNRRETMKSFCSRISNLNQGTLNKLTVTNDDKPSLFSVTDLLSGIYYETQIPITFRFIGHIFNNGGLTVREAMFLSNSTWKGKTPIFIHSESKEKDSEGNFLSSFPSDFLNNRIPTFGLDLDVILEINKKEEACVKYSREFLSLGPIIFSKKNKKRNDKKI